MEILLGQTDLLFLFIIPLIVRCLLAPFGNVECDQAAYCTDQAAKKQDDRPSGDPAAGCRRGLGGGILLCGTFCRRLWLSWIHRLLCNSGIRYRDGGVDAAEGICCTSAQIHSQDAALIHHNRDRKESGVCAQFEFYACPPRAELKDELIWLLCDFRFRTIGVCKGRCAETEGQADRLLTAS